jgi:hypothetical protein
MAGWRDSEGRTARERAQQRGTAERAVLFDALRHRPTSLVKPVLGFLFIMVLVFALIFAMS